MAVSTKINGRQLTVSWSSAIIDWHYTSQGGFETGMRVKAITVDPGASGAASDTFAIRQNDASGAFLFGPVRFANAQDQRIKYFGGDRGEQMFPFIDATDCSSLDVGATVTFDLV